MDIPFLAEFFVALELTVIEDLAAPVVQSSFVLDRPSSRLGSHGSCDKEEFLSLLHLFALPNPSSFFTKKSGVSFFSDTPRSRSDSPHFHEFVLTGENGRHRYGACLMVPTSWAKIASALSKVPDIELPKSVNLPSDCSNRQSPRIKKVRQSQSNSSLFGARNVTCFCLISRFPLLCTLRYCLSDLLSRICTIRQSAQPLVGIIEAWAVSILDIFLPEPGSLFRLELGLPALGQSVLVPFDPLNCENYTPIIPDLRHSGPWVEADIQYSCLFESLSINNIFATLSALLFENRVLLLSNSLTILSHAGETLRILMAPFNTPDVFVPVLPESLSDMIDAPTPFLMGGDSVWASKVLGLGNSTTRSNFRDSACVPSVEDIHSLAGSHSLTNDIVVVDLDTDTLSNFNWGGHEIPWSAQLHLALKIALKRTSGNTADCSADPKNTEHNVYTFERVQQAFLEWNAMLIGDIEFYMTGESRTFDSDRWVLRFKNFSQRTQDWVKNLICSGPFRSYIANHENLDSPTSLSPRTNAFELFRETISASPKWAAKTSLESEKRKSVHWSLASAPHRSSLGISVRPNVAMMDTILLQSMNQMPHQRLEELYSTLITDQDDQPILLLCARLKWVSEDLLMALDLFIRAGLRPIAEELVVSTNEDVLVRLMRDGGTSSIKNQALIFEVMKQHIESIPKVQCIIHEQEPVSPVSFMQETETSLWSAALEAEDLVPNMNTRNSIISQTRDSIQDESCKEKWPILAYTGTPSVSETLICASSRSRTQTLSPASSATSSLPSSPMRNIRPRSPVDLKRGLEKLASSLYLIPSKSQHEARPTTLQVINHQSPEIRECNSKIMRMICVTSNDQFVVAILSALVLEFKAHCRLEYGSHGHPKSFLMTESQQISRVMRSNAYKHIMHGICLLSSSLVDWDSIDTLSSTCRMCVFANLRNIFILQCLCQSHLRVEELGRRLKSSCYNVGGQIFGIERLNQCIISTPRVGSKHPASDSVPTRTVVKASPMVILAMADASLGPQMRIWEPDYAASQLNELASEYIDRAFVLVPGNRGRHTLHVPRMGPGSLGPLCSGKEAQDIVLWIVRHMPETRLVQKMREKDLIKVRSSGETEWRLSQKLTLVTVDLAKDVAGGEMDVPTFPPTVSDLQLKALRDLAVDWAVSHGLCLRPPNVTNTDDCAPHSVDHAPFALFPTPFPRHAFERAQSLQPLFNRLVHSISKDASFLKEVMDSIGNVDPFTARLYSLFCERVANGHPEPITLGIYRSDYLLHCNPADAPHLTIQQVELNTIASSFGCLSSMTSFLHKYLFDTTNFYLNVAPTLDKNPRLPPNPALKNITRGIATAHKLYGVDSAIVVIIVQPDERNVIDQRWIEYELLGSYGVILARYTLAEIYEKSCCKQDGRLMIETHNGRKEVSVAYFRAGYGPTDYPSEKEWIARTRVELSKCVKCPTVAQQLAGTKKVQQVLARPDQLARFVSAGDAEAMRSCFTGLYELNAGSVEGDQAYEMAMAEPHRFVVKPQREGGGNNVYGTDIPVFFQSLKPHERAAYILMELIHPPPMKNVLVRQGALITDARTVSELGIYGVWVANGDTAVINEAGGHLLRTKVASSHEGGVAAGFAVLDSPVLY